MAKCPNCGSKLSWDAAACPGCPALFGPDAAWQPIPETPEEQTLATQRDAARGDRASTGLPEPFFLVTINAAIAVGFLVSTVLPIDALVAFIVDPKTLSSYVPALERAQLRIVVEYVTPSAIAYFVLRKMPLSGLQVLLLFLCNCVLAASVAIRYSIVGQDLSLAGSFIRLGLAVIAMPTLFVAFLVLVTALAKWIMSPSREVKSDSAAGWSNAMPLVLVSLLGFGPLLYFAIRLNLGEDSPRSMMVESKARLTSLCQEMREERYSVPASVNGVYLENPSDDISRSLLRANPGPQFVEVPARPKDIQSKYLRKRHGSDSAERTNDLLAEYGVFHPEILSDRDKRIGLSAVNIVVKDLRSSSVIAELRYYANTKTSDFCVPRSPRSGSGRGISQGLFIHWALGLTP